MASLHLSPADLVVPDSSHHPSYRPFSNLDQAALEAAVGLTPCDPHSDHHPLLPAPCLKPQHFHQSTPNHLHTPHEHQLPPTLDDKQLLHPYAEQIWSLPSAPCPSSPPLTVPVMPKSDPVPCAFSDDALSPLTHPLPAQSPADDPSSSTVSSPLSSPSRPESAVDRAKRLAEDFTQSQLAKKRRSTATEAQAAKRRKSSSCSDEDEPALDDNRPETVSHRKYQKRLQKNRDSAFVSRIRRREYTRVLEETLLKVEQEKDAAVASFLEMKQRFEVASAELSGIKQAARSKLSQLPTVLARLSAGGMGAEGSQPQQQAATRSGTVATMFMFAFMFGTLLPDCIKSKFDSIGVANGRFDFLSKLGSRGGKSGDAKLSQFTDKAGKPGNFWRVPTRDIVDEYRVLPAKQQLLVTVQADAQRLLPERASAFVKEVEAYVNKLSDDEVESLSSQLQQNCTNGDAGAARLGALAQRIKDSSRESSDELYSVIGELRCLAVADKH